MYLPSNGSTPFHPVCGAASPHTGRRIDAKPNRNVKFSMWTVYFRFLENLRDPVREEGLQTGIQIWLGRIEGFVARSHESYSSAMRALGANRLRELEVRVNSPVGSRLAGQLGRRRYII